jgi:hypothetical protein
VSVARALLWCQSSLKVDDLVAVLEMVFQVFLWQAALVAFVVY